MGISRRLESEIVDIYNERLWKDRCSNLKLTNFNDDINHKIDVEGYIGCKDKTHIYMQIKSNTFYKLPIKKRLEYLKEVQFNMNKLDPAAARRLIIYKRNGAGYQIKLYNHNLDKLIVELEQKKQA